MTDKLFNKFHKTLSTIGALIEESDTIIIHSHTAPDADAYGAQLGLAKLIEENYEDKNVRVVGEVSEYLSFLGTIDVIHDSDYKDSLVIVVDTANITRISDPRYNLGKYLVKIDHHPNVEEYGDVNWVDTNYSSASEMIVEFALNQGLTLNDEIARLLYAGIMSDTGRVKFPNTTPFTFRVLAILTGFNFDHVEVIDKLETMSLSQFNYRAKVTSETTYTKRMVAYCEVGADMWNEFNLTEEQACSAVGMYNQVAGLNAWVLAVETTKGIRVRARSKSVEINQILAEYGGGGHPLACGALVQSWDEVRDLVRAIDNAMA